MRIIQDPHPRHCRLLAESSGVIVRVEGLSAVEMAACFGGNEAAFEDLDALVQGRLLCDPGRSNAATDEQMIELPDGQVGMVSGGHARFSFRRRAGWDRLIPQPLNLALAQQWARHGLMPLHACAFEWQDQGVLALGNQGAGKSTLTLAARAAGASIVSDDWILLGCAIEGRPSAERLRRFLMLRDGPALKALRPRLPGLGQRQPGANGRLYWPLPDTSMRFPRTRSIDQVWLLDDQAHPAMSSRKAAIQADLYGQLIDAGMPILFSERFPLERAALTATLLGLLSSCRLYSVRTGHDLLTDPTRVLEKLLNP